MGKDIKDDEESLHVNYVKLIKLQDVNIQVQLGKSFFFKIV